MPAIIGTGTQRAAKTSRVQVGAQNLNFASWEAVASVADLPTVNFESYNAGDDASYSEGVSGVANCEAKFGGSYDAGANPLAAVPGIYPRDALATVNFITSRTDGTQWNFPFMRIRSVSNSGMVEQLVLFSVTDAKNQGRFTRPGQ